MRIRAFAIAVPALFAALSSACSVLFPVDDLTGGSVASDAAAADVSVQDGGGGGDGGDARADAGTFCPPNALFCDDFERDTVAGGPWETIGGVPTISRKEATSPTRSLGIAFDPGNGQGFPNVFHKLSAIPPKMTFRVSMFLGNAPLGGLEIIKLAFGEVNNWDTVTVGIDPNQLTAEMTTYKGSPTPSDIQPVSLLVSGKTYGTGWHVLRIDIDLTTSTRKALVTVDEGTPVAVSIASIQPVPQRVAVSLGLTYGDDTHAFSELYFDDAALVPSP